MQRDPFPTLNQQRVDQVITYLQTRDPAIFPFTANFTEDQERSFVHDLREGLSDLVDSGSKRGTSSTGYLMTDWRLLKILAEWEQANGDWPRGSYPDVAITSLGVADDHAPEPLDTVTFTAPFDTDRPQK
ncbi:MAG TPA: hypothetical protein VNZ55_06390 [Thermomicrobiales bacterium]|nr:hypothetical protein [Thermomicrobiales bacterium]